MRVLVDASYPRAAGGLTNEPGIQFDRLQDVVPDDALVDRAQAGGYGAVLVIGDEMLSDDQLRRRAEEEGVMLVCAVSDDPYQAENHLRGALRALADRLAEGGGGAWWLRADGLRPVEGSGVRGRRRAT